MDRLHTAVRQQAMLTLAQMSKVERLLEGRRKSLLGACFRKVFLLPPNAAGQGQDSFLYFETLDAMDILLESLVLSSPGHRLLQRILQMLLPYTDTKHAAVCERAVTRIAKLAELMARSSSVQVRRQAPSSRAVSHSLPTVGSSLQLQMPEAFSTALPWARVSASFFFPWSSLPSALSARSHLGLQSCAGQHCPRSMAGGQAWQLSLPCCPARCSGGALHNSDPPGSFPGAESQVQGFC
ncbi:uncharacterized protein AAGF69_012472 isoform 2-T2 [Amazona ochrocephala]